MKKEKCVGCNDEFEMPDNFIGKILCEGCDPAMHRQEIKVEYIIKPLQVWKDRENGSLTIVILALSKNKKYVIVSGVTDEVSPLFSVDWLIKNYIPNDLF